MSNLYQISDYRKKKEEEETPFLDNKDPMDLITDISILLSLQIADDLADMGMDIRDIPPNLFPNMIMVTESIKAIACAIQGIPHPLHKVTEITYAVEDPEAMKQDFLNILDFDG